MVKTSQKTSWTRQRQIYNLCDRDKSTISVIENTMTNLRITSWTRNVIVIAMTNLTFFPQDILNPPCDSSPSHCVLFFDRIRTLPWRLLNGYRILNVLFHSITLICTSERFFSTPRCFNMLPDRVTFSTPGPSSNAARAHSPAPLTPSLSEGALSEDPSSYLYVLTTLL